MQNPLWDLLSMPFAKDLSTINRGADKYRADSHTIFTYLWAVNHYPA